jgi:hypothetical protein
MCLKASDSAGNLAQYGVCTVKCDPTVDDSCPTGTVCAIIGNTAVTACWVPDSPRCSAADGRCDDTRAGGTRLCELGTDSQDCCPNIAQGAECDPDAQCGCERKPGTECRKTEGASVATCQPIHPEPLSNACASVSAPGCCNPPIVGSECDPIAQCGCEGKPNTHCQVIDSSGIGGCMKPGKLPAGSVCSSPFEQCSTGYDCHTWDNVCRKACIEHTDCMLTLDGVTVSQVCMKRDGEGIGHCMVICDYASEQPCLQGTRCARFSTDTSACFNPATKCNLTSNQTCDDTRAGGTRLCAYGYDSECK